MPSIPLSQEVLEDWIGGQEAHLLSMKIELPPRGEDSVEYWNTLCDTHQRALMDALRSAFERETQK